MDKPVKISLKDLAKEKSEDFLLETELYFDRKRRLVMDTLKFLQEANALVQ